VSSRTGRPTLAVVAEAAGVSVATVSKVLNGRPHVAADTRARIEASLERHLYRRRTALMPCSRPVLIADSGKQTVAGSSPVGTNFPHSAPRPCRGDA